MQGEVETEGPSESECRPYIEKALKELEAGEVDDDDSKEDVPTVEITTDDSDHDAGGGDDDTQESVENEEDGDDQISDKNEEVLCKLSVIYYFGFYVLNFRQNMIVTNNPQKMKKIMK